MGVDLEEDLKRRMIELNLSAASFAKSPQTGYLHLNYDSEERHDTIPLLENFCYALALFRSRIAENVLEGKTLLEKLLVFENDGNFPVYLHEYPHCKDRDFSLELLPIFHYLLGDFRAALGEALCIRLELLIGRIVSHGYKMHTQRPLSKPSEFRLKSYFEPHAVPSWTPSTPDEWANALITFQMAKSRGIQLDRFLEKSLERWHPQLATYIGLQNQERAEPRVTLLDLFMGHCYGLYSKRALLDKRAALLASLVQPFNAVPEAFQQEVPCHAISNDGLRHYALYWGTHEKLNSLVLDAPNSGFDVERQGSNVEITLSMPPKTFPDGQEAIECSFFVNLVPELEMLVQGAKATTFQLNDAVDLLCDDLQLRLEISLEKGEGRFFGHILRANRPTQKGKNLKYETYDWQIALRTIRRSDDCVIKLKLTL
ncbi:MAG: hypothetical protein JSS60_04700 [Verrucomicrobia bacterium]|nr:hypothetical protein [Verrucomicrobiota bacterium]